MKTKPDLKAYQLNVCNLDTSNESIQRGYVMDAIYGETEHVARRSALKLCYDNGIEETWCDEPLTYVNIKIKRLPEADKFLVDGKLKTQSQIEYDQKVIDNRKMLNQILIDNPNAYAYIRKGGYYYGDNHCGYTEHRYNAGIYTIEDAVKSCLGVDIRDYMRPEIIDINQHNAMVNDMVNKIQSRIITTQP